jgi:UDP-hydrolysing UDP-N-acetyl-D-glucosamine 2-epimerase
MRRLAVVTGTRADYGLLRPLLTALAERSDRVETGLLVTGSHLAPEFGRTVTEIEADGWPIWARIDALLAGDGPSAVCKSMALTTLGMSEALERCRPDLLVGLGDRYELLAAVQAAMVHRIPVAHLHGGESTEGLIDEAIRHAASKMSHLHFTSAEPYRRRLLRMGEAPDRVFTVGALGLDNILSQEAPDRRTLEAELSLALPADRPLILATYHPVTLDGRSPAVAVEAMLAALDTLGDPTCVLTYPNADTLGRDILEPLRRYAARRSGRVLLVPSLGVWRYLGLMRLADAVIGNSSSGIIEAPSLGVPTIDIGDRQKGRLRAASVLWCPEETEAIAEALRRSQEPAFRLLARTSVNPYGDGRAAPRIADRLASEPLAGLLAKRFHDDGPSA